MIEQYKVASPSDYQQVADIYNEHIGKHNATMEEHHYSYEDIKEWIEQFNDRERLYVVLEQVIDIVQRRPFTYDRMLLAKESEQDSNSTSLINAGCSSIITWSPKSSILIVEV